MEFSSLSCHFTSYAKINLFLNVINKRSDGYHNIQTWFQFVDLKDNLIFTGSNSGSKFMTINSNANLGGLERNLIYKAAKAISRYAKERFSVRVNLCKNIPIGSGLGGGSSNAATTLIALNQMWKCRLSNQKLIDIGKALGADVPIFLYQHAAWAEGIGEKLTQKYYKEQFALIIKPRFHASTRILFSQLVLQNIHSLSEKETTIPKYLNNVFFPIISKLYPKVLSGLANLPDKHKLKLTGTGSCFYLLAEDRHKLLRNQRKLEKGVDSWIVKTLNFAPIECVVQKHS